MIREIRDEKILSHIKIEGTQHLKKGSEILIINEIGRGGGYWIEKIDNEKEFMDFLEEIKKHWKGTHKDDKTIIDENHNIEEALQCYFCWEWDEVLQELEEKGLINYIKLKAKKIYILERDNPDYGTERCGIVFISK